MLAEIPVISPLFQILLNAMGWVMAEIYRFIPNYGIAIVVLTLLIKFALLPLGIKQIKSMQHMQAIQPRVKELQKKYKGNKAKIQEETMKLYREAGVSPFGGCLPLLLTFPFLIAMYAVIRMPILQPVPADASGTAVTAYVVHNNHLPVDSRLFHDVISHENTGIGVMNLQCSPAQSGSTAVLVDSNRKPVVPGKPLRNGATEENGNPDTADPLPATLTSKSTLDCGKGIPSRIPYFVLLGLMIATTYYQQRQMNKANPPGASSQQQQAILRIMPLFFGFIGYGFPGGLGLYWTISNLFQIGQQTLLLRAGHIGPDAIDKRIAEQRAKAALAAENPPKRSWLQRMMEQQETQRKMRDSNPPPARGSGSKGSSGKGGSGGRSSSKGGAPQGGSQPRPQGPRRRPNTGSNRKGGGPKKRPGGGTSGGGGDDGTDG